MYCAARQAAKVLKRPPKESAQDSWNAARRGAWVAPPGRFPKESMEEITGSDSPSCPSCEGPLRIGRMGIAISRRESASQALILGYRVSEL